MNTQKNENELESELKKIVSSSATLKTQVSPTSPMEVEEKAPSSGAQSPEDKWMSNNSITLSKMDVVDRVGNIKIKLNEESKQSGK